VFQSIDKQQKTKKIEMKTKAGRLGLASMVLLLATSGCSTLRKSDFATLQGTWQGKEIGRNTEGPSYLIVTGNVAEFRGPDTNDWLKATFTLREDTNPKQVAFVTTVCAYTPYVGKTRYGIYQIEAGMIRITANEPDNPVPTSFDAPGGRQFELRRK
jgi:uncharacterized protein (TIGR03067 family)